MTAPESYLLYPNRRAGNDHEKYEWSNSLQRTPLRLPDGKSVAVVVVPVLEWFPLGMSSMPVSAVGSLDNVHPEIWRYSVRDYGNRVGIFRLLRAIEKMGARPTVALNAAIAHRYPPLMAHLRSAGSEFVAHGLDMGNLHHSMLAEDVERQMVSQTFALLRELAGGRVRGWHSPGYSESERTLELVSAEGADFALGWANDDLPYTYPTASGGLTMLPTSFEMDDACLIGQHQQPAENYAAQIVQFFQRLKKEGSEVSGRVLTIMLHGWISGQASNIQPVEDALLAIANDEATWLATGSEIADCFTKTRI